MSEYKVRINEVLEMIVTVEAESATQAREIVESGYKNSEYILDADNYRGVVFSTPVKTERER
jgi:hypothetical protein